MNNPFMQATTTRENAGLFQLFSCISFSTSQELMRIWTSRFSRIVTLFIVVLPGSNSPLIRPYFPLWLVRSIHETQKQSSNCVFLCSLDLKVVGCYPFSHNHGSGPTITPNERKLSYCRDLFSTPMIMGGRVNHLGSQNCTRKLLVWTCWNFQKITHLDFVDKVCRRMGLPRWDFQLWFNIIFQHLPVRVPSLNPKGWWKPHPLGNYSSSLDNHLSSSSISPYLGVGNSNIFGIFTPDLGEDEPILTSIFFKGVVQPPSDSITCSILVYWTSKVIQPPTNHLRFPSPVSTVGAGFRMPAEVIVWELVDGPFCRFRGKKWTAVFGWDGEGGKMFI